MLFGKRINTMKFQIGQTVMVKMPPKIQQGNVIDNVGIRWEMIAKNSQLLTVIDVIPNKPTVYYMSDDYYYPESYLYPQPIKFK